MTTGAPTLLRVAVVTNEPWGTYHLRALAAEAPEHLRLQQVVPSLDNVPTVNLGFAVTSPEVEADLLVVTGLTDWPCQVLTAHPWLPVVASCLAYMKPTPAEDPTFLRDRIRSITAAGPADAAAFRAHLGLTRSHLPVRTVGHPVLDTPVSPDRTGHTLILTSVTQSDETGGSAPGTETLRRTALRLAVAGHDVVVRLHPREDPAVWTGFTIDNSPSARAAASGSRVVVGIPGTAFAEIAADGTPLVGVTADGLSVPGHLLDLCGSLITDTLSTEVILGLVDGAVPAGPGAVHAAVGPRDGNAVQRLFDAWTDECVVYSPPEPCLLRMS